MAIRSKQQGQDAEYGLLYEILKQLERLKQVLGSLSTTDTTTTSS